MDTKNNRQLKYACYSCSVAMSATVSISPLLFVTFRNLYGISFSLLGLLVLINFVTQLLVDLAFSFFSHRFNITLAVKGTGFLSAAGLLLFAVLPRLFPTHAYAGFVVGTILFSAASGLSEVFGSPIIAALPAKDPDREMSKLHSCYAWGCVFVVLFSTLFLHVVGTQNWHWLVVILALIPLTSGLLFLPCTLPHIQTPEKASGTLKLLRNKGIWLCVLAIFLGGSAECTMSQWCSGYLEQALGLPKLWGDVFGVALFALMMGLGRSLYGKFGRHLGRILTLGMLCSALCYFIAATGTPLIGLLACAFTGFCTSMLWPGTLVVASERFPDAGLFIFAIMAAGGDLGASVGPQLVGVVTDAVMVAPGAASFAAELSLTAEQLGMKLGLLVGMLFPLVGTFIQLHLWRTAKK